MMAIFGCLVIGLVYSVCPRVALLLLLCLIMKYKYALILFVILISSIFSVAQAAPAQPTNTQDDWVRSVITAEASSAIPAPCSDEADAVKVRFENSGETERVGGCILKGGDFDFITSDSYQSGDEPFYQVLYARDNLAENPVFAQLNDTGSVRKFLYSARSGQLIEIINEPNYARSLLIYKDIRETLQAVRHSRDGKIMEYTVNQNSLGVIKHGYNFSLNNPAITRNGKYIVLGYSNPNSGTIEKIDTTTGLMQSFGTPLNMDINLKVLGVSDSGRYVLVKNTHTVYIYDTQTCNAFDDDGQTVCESRDLGALVSEPQGVDPSKVYLGRFITNDTGIDVGLMASGQSSWARLSISKFGLEYLALGDSFSSGEGDIGINPVTNRNFYRNFTDINGIELIGGQAVRSGPREMCHVSIRSYPYKLATGMEVINEWNENDLRWQSLACSGAIINDMGGLNDAGSYKGQDDGVGGPRLDGYDMESLKAQALNEMIPGRQKQIKFVEKYQPRVITLTAGGNDINFGGIIRACVQPILDGGEWTSTCSYAKDDGKKAHIAQSIIDLRSDLVTLYKDLQTAGNSNVKIYVLGYPVIVDDESVKNNYIIENITKCGPNVRLNYEERNMISESTKFLNRIIRSAAQEAGVIYIDTTDALGDGRLCGKSSTKAANGITGLSNNNESFHPNQLGNAYIANRVWEATKGESLISYECKGTRYVTCPDETSSSVEVPRYFKKAIEGSIATRIDNSMSSNVLIKFGKALVNIADYTLLFNSPLTIALYSEETKLGSFVTNSEGGLSQEVTISGDTKPGYHTLEVKAVDSTGNAVKLWKIVEVRSNNPDDYDDDGIPNNHDQCQYIEPVGLDADMDGVDDGCDPEVADIKNSLNINEVKNEITSSNHPRSAYVQELNVDNDNRNMFTQGLNSQSSNSLLKNQFDVKNVDTHDQNKQTGWPPFFLLLAVTLSAILFTRKKIYDQKAKRP